MKKASRTPAARIHKLQGQLSAIEEMIAKKRSCDEVLHQIAAVRAGIEQLGVIVFQNELCKLSAKKKLTVEDIQSLSQSFSKTT